MQSRPPVHLIQRTFSARSNEPLTHTHAHTHSHTHTVGAHRPTISNTHATIAACCNTTYRRLTSRCCASPQNASFARGNGGGAAPSAAPLPSPATASQPSNSSATALSDAAVPSSVRRGAIRCGTGVPVVSCARRADDRCATTGGRLVEDARFYAQCWRPWGCWCVSDGRVSVGPSAMN